MCRLFGLYANKPVDVSFSFYKARKSFKKQSVNNPQGWGIAWFDGKKWNVCKEPLPLYKSQLAESLARRTLGKIVISHVRLATRGTPTVGNTHPWLYRGWVFAHNGTIDAEGLYGMLREEYRDFEGETDSERFFHFIIQEVEELGNPADGVKSAVDKVREKNIHFSSLNFIASDGKGLYALRYAAENESYYTLYYTERPGEPLLKMLSGETRQLIEVKLARGEKAVVIASEPMTEEEEWKLIENGHLIVVDADLNIKDVDLS
jgi:predicted glutamine amidotransferase